MRVDVFEPAHMDVLRTRGVQPAQARTLSHVPASYATLVRPPGPALSVFDGDKIMLCGGIFTANPKLGTLWAVLAADAGAHMVWLHRAVLRFIDTQPVRRLEASVEEGFAEGCRWLRLLGFEFEGAMRAYGEDGETHLRFARIRL